MSDRGTSEPDQSGKVVAIRNRALPSRKRMNPREHYPLSWRAACREIVLRYQEVLREAAPKRSGAKTIRNHIMGTFDFADDSLLEENNLSGSDVGHWLRNDTFLSPVKFGYIDLFVKQIQLEPRYHWVRGAIIDYHEKRHKTLFKEIYMSARSDEVDLGYDLKNVNEAYFRSEPLKSGLLELWGERGERFRRSGDVRMIPYREIWLYIRNVNDGIASVTVVYLQTPISDINLLPKQGEWTVTYGFLIPMEDRKSKQYNRRGNLKRRNILADILKTFRPEVQGLQEYAGHTSSKVLSTKESLIISWDDNVVTAFDLSGGAMERPLLKDEDSDLNTIVKFEFKNNIHPKLHRFVSNLTNRYLIW